VALAKHLNVTSNNFVRGVMCEILKPWLQNLNEMHEKACLVSTRYCIYQGEGCSRKAALKMKLESNPHECDDHPEGSEIHQSGRTTNLDQEAVKTPLVGTGAPPRPKGNAMDGEAVPIRSSPHPRATWRSWGPHADRWTGSHVATAPCGPLPRTREAGDDRTARAGPFSLRPG
jgi:hypothetical protein